MELAAIAAVLVLCVIWLVHTSRGSMLSMIAVAVFAASAFALSKNPKSAPAMGAPEISQRGQYVSSNACRSCHPSEYASWARTYHRTMTQRPTRANVPLGDKLFARGNEVWTDQGRVALVTGSHHEQAFWILSEGQLTLYPFVWLVEQKTFVPRKDAFIDPPDAERSPVHWSSNCIQCHTTAGKPSRPSQPSWAEPGEVGELGIACEACHGPGEAHVRKHADPIERWTSRGSKKSDLTIIHPKKISAERSSQLCGQCHAYAYPRDEADWWKNGYTVSFRPGQSLDGSRYLLTLDVLRKSGAPGIDAEASSVYWDDGTMRVGGREYNAMILSPCFERGEGDRKMACTSCHTMHSGDSNDQLAPMQAACITCHPGPDRSHHAAGSEASECVACHMPRTSYALFSAIRSHRIESPRIGGSRLPACNLCHLDRTLAWTQDKLSAWYGQKPITLPEERVPAAVAWALRGDAAERALAADALGRPEGLRASGSQWEGRILQMLQNDPYAAVRFIATQSLRNAGSSVELVPESIAREELVHRNDRPVTIAE